MQATQCRDDACALQLKARPNLSDKGNKGDYINIAFAFYFLHYLDYCRKAMWKT